MMFIRIKKSILNFLDHNYYRVAKFYFRREGSDAITAVIHVCMIITFSIAPFLIFLLLFVCDVFDIKRGEGLWVIRILVLLKCLAIYLLVSPRYKGSGVYLKLRDKWHTEKKSAKYLKGVGVVLSVLIPFILSMTVVIKRDPMIKWIHTFWT